jgi:hypothetical protein
MYGIVRTLFRKQSQFVYHRNKNYITTWRDFTISRVPQCLSHRPNWVRRPPLPQASVPPPEQKRGGGNTRLRGGGVGGPDSDDWRESLALCVHSVGLYFLV